MATANSNENNIYGRNSSTPRLTKTRKYKNKNSKKHDSLKHDSLIKILLMSQVLSAAVIQNLPETPEIGMTKQTFTNSNKPVYPEIESNNTINIVTGLYGKSINSNANANNDSNLKAISSILEKQIDLSKKLNITQSDIDKASKTLLNLIKSHKDDNKQSIRQTHLSPRNSKRYTRLSKFSTTKYR